ncbi:hypothetical protein VAG18_002921 [Escherichia coli]|nr:hypothetical protein [Escherichia coli]
MATIQDRLNKTYCLFDYNGDTILAYRGAHTVWIKGKDGGIVNLSNLKDRKHRYFVESMSVDSDTPYSTGDKVIIDNLTWYVVDWQVNGIRSRGSKYTYIVAR